MESETRSKGIDSAPAVDEWSKADQGAVIVVLLSTGATYVVFGIGATWVEPWIAATVGVFSGMVNFAVASWGFSGHTRNSVAGIAATGAVLCLFITGVLS